MHNPIQIPQEICHREKSHGKHFLQMTLRLVTTSTWKQYSKITLEILNLNPNTLVMGLTIERAHDNNIAINSKATGQKIRIFEHGRLPDN